MNQTMLHTNRQYRGHRGFTLLEVIVAMTLLAFSIAGILGAVSACVRSNDAAAGYSRGTLLAQQVAAELERSDTLESGDLSGTFDDLSAGYEWEARIAAGEQGVYPVHIIVTWEEGRRQCELSTMVRPHSLPEARPATSSPSATTQSPAPGSESSAIPPVGGGAR